MASQHVLFAETITAMKKARKRRAYDSDSDSEVDHHGNRGYKLKKKARFAHEGQLAPPSGPELYREVVNHAGHRRAIISRNPPLIDDEGYEVDSDDDEENIHDAMTNAAEFNPYANIRLENILAPLTRVTDLPTHQTLSRPYTSKTLTELSKQALGIMHKENAALWKIKHLQTKLIGDHTWAPCELMVGPNDIEFFDDDYMDRSQAPGQPDRRGIVSQHLQTEHKLNGYPTANGSGHPLNSNETQHDLINIEKADVLMADAESPPNGVPMPQDSSSSQERDAKNITQHDTKDSEGSILSAREADALSQRNGRGIARGASSTPVSLAVNGLPVKDTTVSEDVRKANMQIVALNGGTVEKNVDEMTRQVSDLSDSFSELPIHPMFLPPRSARPDRDFGLPEHDAEDVRRILQLMVQKQEEVCRGVKRLYSGLLRADKLRNTVLKWSKYEAHRDMSDGEDWYDKEEWGLEEDLKKGQDEEEDEPQTTKKTRNRR